MNTLTLRLFPSESIIFLCENSFTNLVWCDEFSIEFRGEEKIGLYANIANEALISFKNKLSAALEHTLIAPKNLQENLGCTWNRILKDEENIVYETIPHTQLWVGQKYLLWSQTGNNPSDGTSWLYNNEKGEIIWEVTPTYPWIFFEPQPGEYYFSYEDFMKNYKPLLTRIIPREVAQEWLNQIIALVQRVDVN